MEKEKLRQIVAASGADALFLEQDFLRRYVTGFYSTDGYVVADKKGCSFFADPRYLKRRAHSLQVVLFVWSPVLSTPPSSVRREQRRSAFPFLSSAALPVQGWKSAALP